MAVFGMKLSIPEEGVLEPLFLGESKERLNLGADV
jgi:hypothetical protein